MAIDLDDEFFGEKKKQKMDNGFPSFNFGMGGGAEVRRSLRPVGARFPKPKRKSRMSQQFKAKSRMIKAKTVSVAMDGEEQIKKKGFTIKRKFQNLILEE